MHTETIKTAEANAAKYQHEDVQDAYTRGFERGFNCASWQDLPEVGDKVHTESEGRVVPDRQA